MAILMDSTGCYEQQGVVKEIQEGLVTVNFSNASLCAACHAKGVCGMSNIQQQSVQIRDSSGTIRNGDRVKIRMRKTLGMKALMLGYIFPFILLILVLIILTASGNDELTAGLVSLASLVPYYVALFFFREKISKAFVFEIEKIDRHE